MIEVEYVVADGLIVAYGAFPSGEPSDPAHAIAEVDDAEAPKLAEPGTKYLEADGTIRVVPPPPPPRISAQQFETAEDVERLALVNERAQADPAFAALAELTLGTKGVQT